LPNSPPPPLKLRAPIPFRSGELGAALERGSRVGGTTTRGGGQGGGAPDFAPAFDLALRILPPARLIGM
jgi:hypothetical protein